MNARKYLIATAALSIVITSMTAFGDVVLLKNGKILEVERAWQEGDQIWFVYQDMKASIPQSKVTRIESDSGDPENQINAEIQESGAPSAQKTLSNLNDRKAADHPSGRNKTPLVLHEEGLGDLKWGDKAANVKGLKIRYADSGLKDVVEYIRPHDALILGEATLTSVVYAFWRNQLYTITVWTRGHANYLALRKAAFEHFGDGIQVDRSGKEYLWSNDHSDVMLEYAEADQYGMLWMRCKELDRKYKLSQLSGHTSYIRLMKSKN